ncbi:MULTISPECIES: serine hydrolase domain-containing protein [Paenibacillus]|uniref:Beta-lactamase n=2 Tax=Paenibacillus lactis TaxID=228574 RepID=G4HDD5_9BACL|nr:serine hydrolase domain-containing protein [Paenibacillus lactis]EHB66061.1 beta-lactamase [Paenibacillus lactis 154]MBP1891448.1 CubicO group peptidase (beta-lactamase class C family) [Paenibacillus lactis]MCM3493873.1 beta-lactamase family protein [Paenibacillus lactis]HAF98183.1 serine hydrolase [Paenibacillus lactis]
MRKFLLIVITIALLSPFFYLPQPTLAAAPVLDKETVDDYIERYLGRNGLPGASIVIVKDGEIIHAQGYGHDSEGSPITEHSLMRIGSVSKTFTAFAILQLVDEGAIQLDDPVIRHLPKLTMDDNRFGQVTIRHLLSHTSGIPNPTIVPKADTLEQGVSRLHSWKLQSNPGERHFYSNANYWILAWLVENVSGMEFAAYLDTKVFSPLGMDDSLSPVNSRVAIPGLPRGHVTAYGTAIPISEMEIMFSGAGGIVTTAADMGKWLSMHTDDGVSPSGVRLLSSSLLEESYSPQPGSEHYGLGWSLSSSGVAPQRIQHSGALSSYQAQQSIVLSSGYAIAVILNSFTTTFEHAYEMSSGIIQLTEGQAPAIKAPVPTIIDLSLGFLTLLYASFGIRGILRSKKWSDQRQHHSAVRYYLRLIPQLIPIAGIGWLMFVVPELQDNSSTTLDVFRLWPALAILLSIIFLCAVFMTGKRIYYRLKGGRS